MFPLNTIVPAVDVGNGTLAIEADVTTRSP